MKYYRTDAMSFLKNFRTYENKRAGKGFLGRALLDARHPVLAIARKREALVPYKECGMAVLRESAERDAKDALLELMKATDKSAWSNFPRGHILRALSPLREDGLTLIDMDYEPLRMRFRFPDNYAHVKLLRLMAFYMTDGVTKSVLEVKMRGADYLDFAFKPTGKGQFGSMPLSTISEPLAKELSGKLYWHNGRFVFSMRTEYY